MGSFVLCTLGLGGARARKTCSCFRWFCVWDRDRFASDLSDSDFLRISHRNGLNQLIMIHDASMLAAADCAHVT